MFQQMGFGVAVSLLVDAILVDATFIRMVIVPAAVTALGRWNCYLPSWLAWLPELHVEETPPPEMPAAAPDPLLLPV